MTGTPLSHTGGNQPVPMPLVVLAGPSVAGKTTVATALAAAADLDHWTPSELQKSELDEVTTDRAGPGTDAVRAISSEEADRITALAMLAEFEHALRPLVVESAALPLLLPPNNLALIVRLSARLPVRIGRLRAIRPELSATAARTILRGKDHATRGTRGTMRPAWGVDPDAVGACQWRSDLVVQCPDAELCSDPRECAVITADLVIAAYEVYRGYLTVSPAATTVHRLNELIRANRTRIRRCTPLLTDPAAEFSVSRWRNRLLIELDQARKADTP